MRRMTLSCLVVALALAACGVSAQDADIKLGTKVRVISSGTLITGTLAGLNQRAIVLRRKDGQVELPLADVERLEVLKPGRKGHHPEMILAGAVGGSLMGALVGAGGVNSGSAYGTRTDRQIAADVKTGAAVGAVLGAVGGYFVSRFAIHRDPQWEAVEVHPRIRINALPIRGRGLGVAVCVAF